MSEIIKVDSFHGCYLLTSLNEKSLGHIYIGYTVDPLKRLSKHNHGCDKGGARKTSGKQPWQIICVVHHFPNEICALKFEWAWQHPNHSKRLKNIIPKKKSIESRSEYRLKIMSIMLNTNPWNKMSLRIFWMNYQHEQSFAKCAPYPIPTHMATTYSNPEQLMIQRLVPRTNLSLINFEICSICKSYFGHDDSIINHKFLCPNNDCLLVAHAICLAKTKTNSNELIPIDYTCPLCNKSILWGDLIRSNSKYVSWNTKRSIVRHINQN